MGQPLEQSAVETVKELTKENSEAPSTVVDTTETPVTEVTSETTEVAQ